MEAIRSLGVARKKPKEVEKQYDVGDIAEKATVSGTRATEPTTPSSIGSEPPETEHQYPGLSLGCMKDANGKFCGSHDLNDGDG